MLKLTFILILAVPQGLFADNCLLRAYGEGNNVCVCNDDHCDTIKPIEKIEYPNYKVYTSNKAGLRFDEQTATFKVNNAHNREDSDNLIILGTNTYQEINGFGGAFTDSTGINIKSLNENLQEVLLRSYYSNEGIEYNIGRVPIGASDFSTRPYSYCDTENNEIDMALEHFSLAPEDYNFKIPYIHRANNLTNGNLKLFSSLWIAPGWMKTQPEFTAKFSFIKKEMYQVYAEYLVKFLDAYKENGIDIWGITTGNEPVSAYVSMPLPSVAWTPDKMAIWIRENLGPTIRSSSHADIKLLILDDNAILLPWAVDYVFEDEITRKYIDGIAVHFYMDPVVGYSPINDTHNKHPDKFLLMTEACNGYTTNKVELGSWQGAEDYASDIIENLNFWATGWTDWNMALDIQGGPNFINNFVDAPIIVNATAGEFYKQPSFYAMGHFSKLLPRGSVRLELTANLIQDVQVTAFKRPDDGIAVIVLNKNTQEVPITVRNSQKEINLNLTPNSINSIVYWQ